MSIIKIQVIGRNGTGKTTIAQEIVDALRSQKFDVEWNTTPDHSSEDSARRRIGDQNLRLEAILMKEPKIIIEEININKELKINNE